MWGECYENARNPKHAQIKIVIRGRTELNHVFRIRHIHREILKLTEKAIKPSKRIRAKEKERVREAIETRR